MRESHDVIVVVGGTAGTAAAVQAGRCGRRVLLVERTGMPGGTMTMAGINFRYLDLLCLNACFSGKWQWQQEST